MADVRSVTRAPADQRLRGSRVSSTSLVARLPLAAQQQLGSADQEDREDESALAAVTLPAMVTAEIAATRTDRAMRMRMGFSLAYVGCSDFIFSGSGCCDHI
ncbi:hypothetical protein GCM10023334_060220 [Nonomuraea thailandensis]